MKYKTSTGHVVTTTSNLRYFLVRPRDGWTYKRSNSLATIKTEQRRLGNKGIRGLDVIDMHKDKIS